jgi:hypothetical protein
MSKNVSSADNQQETSFGYNLINHKWGILRDYTPDISCKISKKFASLLAILFTDGCVSPKDNNSWRIIFGNSSRTLIDLFKDCMCDVFRLDEKRIRIREKNNNFWTAVVNSKIIGKYLVSRFGTFRTLKYKSGELPKTKLPVKQLISDNTADEFLKVAFSCDGGLCFYPARRKNKRGETKWLIRTVFLACHHPKLRKDYMSLLKFLGIKARNVSGDGKIKIENKKDICKFAKTIGFVKNVKITNHSKFWRDCDKNYVLNRMISSYKNPSLIYNLSKFVR